MKSWLVMGVWWDYQTTTKGQIRVEAWDLAGNVTRREFRRRHPVLSDWEKVTSEIAQVSWRKVCDLHQDGLLFDTMPTCLTPPPADDETDCGK